MAECDWFWRERAPPKPRARGRSSREPQTQLDVKRLEHALAPPMRHYLYFDSWKYFDDDERHASSAANNAQAALKEAGARRRRKESEEAYSEWTEKKAAEERGNEEIALENTNTRGVDGGERVDGATAARRARLRAEPERLKWRSKKWRSELIDADAFARPHPDDKGGEARRARAVIVAARLAQHKHNFVTRWCFKSLKKYAQLRAWSRRKKREREAIAESHADAERTGPGGMARRMELASKDREKWRGAEWRRAARLEGRLRPQATAAERQKTLETAAKTARRNIRIHDRLEAGWQTTQGAGYSI